MTTVYLIRHGELEYPRNNLGQRLLYGPDVPLSDKGRRQIQELSERFVHKGRKLEKIYTSPFRRAVETAEIFASRLQLSDPVRILEFQDISPGSMVGKLLDDVIQGRLQEYGETHFEVLERMMKGLQQVVEKEKERSIAIVSHGDSIRVLLFHLMYPKDPLPSIDELIKTDYLDKGEAWRLLVDDALHVVEKEYIGRPLVLWGNGERKS